MIAVNYPAEDRVRAHTKPEVLERIDRKIEENIRLYANQPKEIISRRIDELEREWDIERALEANGSILGLTSLLLAITHSKAWLIMTGAIFGFCLQHAVKGWCPPLSVMRQMGIRTQKEIDREIYALKVLRGDFRSIDIEPQQELPHREQIDQVLSAIRN